ncbi:MAG: Hsp20/alpha crystallin family protein [Candidatus Eisenbacteria bacterium]|nr:Hsp20/alpha crystallin family protein [Candidatus Eisenbacteria bacterium]
MTPWMGSPWTGFRGLQDLQTEMNRLFDAAFGSGEGMLTADWTPPVDVLHEDGGYRVRADLPGMSRDQIEVTLDGETLTIRGEKKQEKEVKEDAFVRTERRHGTFLRALTLPSAIDASKVEATYKDGVLEIWVPKSEEARPKQIKIAS